MTGTELLKLVTRKFLLLTFPIILMALLSISLGVSATEGDPCGPTTKAGGTARFVDSCA